MISRRLLRIKTLLILYGFFQSDDASINKSEKDLFFSIKKTYDLYHYLMLLLIDISDYAKNRIELRKQKKMPTEEDLNPNTRFIENKIIEIIRQNEEFNSYLYVNKLSWVNYPELIKNLYNEIIESEEYKSYLESPNNSIEDDKNFLEAILVNIIYNHDPLFQVLEERSVFWNDDVDFVISIIIKTIKKFKAHPGKHNELFPLYKNNDDKDYVKNLYRKTVLNDAEYKNIVQEFAKNWDVERIAYIDIIIMQMAIAEAIQFNSIPIKVTLNEFIEIAKMYSTPKSCPFINGILDKSFEKLKKEKKIIKTGRGLIE